MGNLSTPIRVQKLQMALHAKAKAEAGYRFYALYDKIYREDVLAHAYAQCRSNKGAPGVDRQDFTEVEAYGVQKWLGELALALRQETYRPDPIRRVFIPNRKQPVSHKLPHGESKKWTCDSCTTRKSAPFQVEANLEPLCSPLQAAIRFLRVLIPASSTALLTVCLP
ncbi:hypothetical protein [Paraburkholderia terrae]